MADALVVFGADGAGEGLVVVETDLEGHAVVTEPETAVVVAWFVVTGGECDGCEKEGSSKCESKSGHFEDGRLGKFFFKFLAKITVFNTNS